MTRLYGVLATVALLACAPARTPEIAPPAPAPAPPEPALLLRGGTVLTAAGPRLEGADVLVVGRRIRAVGSDLDLPPAARVIDVAGRWVTPGLIDPHAPVGASGLPPLHDLRAGLGSSSRLAPTLRAEDDFWPQDPAIRRAVAGGVTTIHVPPGSAGAVAGQGLTLRLRRALSVEAMRFPGAPRSMQMTCGGSAETARLREALQAARRYSPLAGEPFDPASDALAQALRGEILIQLDCLRAEAMLLYLDLLADLGAAPRAFHHAVEAYKIRDALARASVGAVVWADGSGREPGMLDAIPAAAALLDAAGVRVALHSDSPGELARLNQEAAMARAAGLRAGLAVERAAAIRWITVNPAWILGIDTTVGTLEPGKQADLVVWSGDPFSVYTRADLVFLAGELVFARGDPGSFPISDFELGRGGAP